VEFTPCAWQHELDSRLRGSDGKLGPVLG